MNKDPNYETLHARISELETMVKELRRAPPQTSLSPSLRKWGTVFAGTLAGVVLLKAGLAYAQTPSCAQTLPPSLVTFCANTPATAADMNQNFQWVVDKVGTSDTGLQTANMTASEGTMGTLTASEVTVDELHVNDRFTPMYSTWSDPGNVAGGAAIVNDNQSYKKLMIVGNRSAGDVRQVGLWDDVTVSRNLRVQGTLYFNRQNCHRVTSRDVWNYCPDGEFVAGVDHDNNNDGIGGLLCCQL